MEEKYTDTITSQIRSVLWSHLYSSIIMSVMGLFAFWWFMSKNIWQQLISSAFIIAYACVMYSKGERLAKRDKYSVSTLKPYPLKGVVLSLSVSAITFLLWLCFYITWNYMSIDGSIEGVSGIIFNMLFMVWTYMYNGIMGAYHGGIHWYAHVLMYLVPTLSLGIGYFAGYKDFDISEKIDESMYEREKSDKK